MKGNRINHFFQGDKAIWAIFFFLCVISLVEVFSAASTLTYKSVSYWSPLIRHAIFLIVGTFLVVGVHWIPCRWFKLIPLIGIPLSVLLLLLLLGGFGVRMNEGARWMDLFGFRFQPSEIAKGALVITTALILSRSQEEKGANRKAFKYICMFTFMICGLIAPENLSTAALLLGVIILMMFIGRIPLTQIGKLLGGLALLASVLLGGLFMIPEDTGKDIAKYPLSGRALTWKHRIEKHITHAEKTIKPEDFDIDRDAQIAHANIAIATSNLVGKMPGNSVERDFLSQAFSDFIYAIIIEELGLIGGAFVLFLYIVLLFRCGRIASRCERNFPAFLVMGLALLLVSQAFLNMLVAVGIFPVTGQPLPLISRGGTSTFINCIYIGMILSVSRYAKKKDNPLELNAPIEETHEISSEFYEDKNLD